MTTKHLTSKNLFDCVFDDIPDEATLDLGPLSLREALAFAAEPVALHHGRHSEFAKGDFAEDVEDTLGENADQQSHAGPQSDDIDAPNQTTTLAPSLLPTALVSSAVSMPAMPLAGTSSNTVAHLELTMNRDDKAVKEATKYADFIAQERQDQAEVEASWQRAMTTGYTGQGHGDTVDNHAIKTNTTSRSRRQDNVDSLQRATMSAEDQLRCMPPGEKTRYEGSCATYRHDKGYGFITPDLGGPDIYFVRDAVQFYFTKMVLKVYYEKYCQNKSLPASLQNVEVSVHKNKTSSHVTDTATNTTNLMPPSNSLHDEPRQGTIDNNQAQVTNDQSSIDNPKEQENNIAEDLADSSVQQEQVMVAKEGSPNGALLHKVKENVDAQSSTTDATNMSHTHQPTITQDDYDIIQHAATLLQPQTAQLLQWQIDLNRGCATRQERLSFTVQRNRVAGLRGNSRLLRAEHICGPATAHHALGVEQAWFYPLFPSAVGRKALVAVADPTTAVQVVAELDTAQPCAERQGSSSAAVDATATVSIGETDADAQSGTARAPLLPRYEGTVRVYNSEEQRGYLRSAEAGDADVFFYGSAVLWDSAVPAPRRILHEGVRVQYSVAGRDRHQKYIATLITAPDGALIQQSHLIVTTEHGGLAEADAAVLLPSGMHGSGDGHGVSRGGQTRVGTRIEGDRPNAGSHTSRDRDTHRKRQRDDEEVLLFDENDYALF